MEDNKNHMMDADGEHCLYCGASEYDACDDDPCPDRQEQTGPTPGPWRVETCFPDVTKGHNFEPRVWIMGIDPNLGDVRLADIPDPDAESLANAQLIAAAPDLLDSVYDLMIACEALGVHPDGVVRARLAIKKAEVPR